MRPNRNSTNGMHKIDQLKSVDPLGRMVIAIFGRQQMLKGILIGRGVATLCQFCSDQRPIGFSGRHGSFDLFVADGIACLIQIGDQIQITLFLVFIEPSGNGHGSVIIFRLDVQCQNVQIMSHIIRGKLHTWNGMHRLALSCSQKFRQTQYGIMVRQCHCAQTDFFSQLHQLCRSQCSIRKNGMGMKITKLLHHNTSLFFHFLYYITKTVPFQCFLPVTSWM